MGINTGNEPFPFGEATVPSTFKRRAQRWRGIIGRCTPNLEKQSNREKMGSGIARVENRFNKPKRHR